MKCFLIAALTADGFIAKDELHNSTRWTSNEDAAWFNQKSKEAQIVIMGSNTFQTINRPLPGRVTIVYSRKNTNNLVENQTKLELDQVYYTQLSPADLLSFLEKLGFQQAAISGGSSIYTMFVKAGLVNEFYLTIEPQFFGQGINLFNQDLNIQLNLVEVKNLSNQTLLLHYAL